MRDSLVAFFAFDGERQHRERRDLRSLATKEE